MSAIPLLAPGEFTAFFTAVHGHEPFPWQKRLAQLVTDRGWPSVLDLPTGSGKTAALDIALFALALDVGKTPRSAPLRIVYVVDRRTIVDQAYERAKKIRHALAAAEGDVVGRVQQRLARYSSGGAPLRTALLRGGIARDDVWARTPDQPLIAVSTVDQAGSRLLFRGYGVTDSMKPIHAGLLGCDVLYLLDEVHLSQPFRETLAAIGDRYGRWGERTLPNPFIVVEMSATPGSSGEQPFRLDEDDRRDATLSIRLQASKPAILVSSNNQALGKEVEKGVLSMLDRPAATIAVIVNRVKSARELHGRLSQVLPSDSGGVHLLTGRMRPFDRYALEQSLLQRIRAGRKRSTDDQPIVVVATQAIEAGADFDFDDLITECASLDALRQRFGRLDRLGHLWGQHLVHDEALPARGIVIAQKASLTDDPVYGDAIGKTWDWLQANSTEQTVDFGIDALVVPHDADEQGLTAPKAHAPILLPCHLDAWVQTAPIPDPDPDVSLWLHGPQRGAADVQIVWRADLTAELLSQAVDTIEPTTSDAAEVAIGMIEALPPVSAEAILVSFLAAKRWLDGQPEPESFDVEGAIDVSDEALDPTIQSVRRGAVVWQGEQSRVILANELRPGQTIIVPSSYGGIANYNWAPNSAALVPDVAELSSLRAGRRPTLRLHRAIVQGLFGPDVVAPEPPGPDAEAVSDRDIVINWLESRHALASDERLRGLLGQLLGDRGSLRVERLPLTAGEGAGEYFIVAGRRRALYADEGDAVDDQTTADDNRSSFTGVEVTLADHLNGVAEMASGFAERVGLPAGVVADLRLAGLWHDAGKADPRFQRWLHGGSEFKVLVQSQPLAKGTARLSSRSAMRLARERAGYPAGGRHELTSFVLMDSAGEQIASRAVDWSFVQHMVTSHHGYCRPIAPWVCDPDPVDVRFSRDGITCNGSSAHELARVDSGVAERFWQMVRLYGWWRLAWLEALLRLADHRQSEWEQSSMEKTT